MVSNLEGTGAWDSMMWLIVLSFLTLFACTEKPVVLGSDATSSGKSENFITHKSARRELDDIGGYVSIDCGLPAGSSYTDEITGLLYKSDEEFIGSGVNKDISSKFMSATLEKSLANVRSFPEGNRNCYTMRPSEGKGTIYMIRASFMYGDYDDQDKLPEFDLYVGVNLWDTVKFDNDSHVLTKEIVFSPLMDEIYVCLLNTDKGTPFISTLELRHFHNSIYTTTEPEHEAIALYRRLDLGSTSNQITRLKDDRYDRIWSPYPCSASINTSSTTDSLIPSDYRLPSTVMETAMEPVSVNDTLDLEFEIGDPTFQFYVYLHFAELEILQVNQYREFNIELNGNQWKESIVLKYLESTTIFSNQSMRGSKLNFSLYKTSKSTLPPILNAMEIYILKDFKQASTNQEDVNAIMEIKSRYKVDEIWQGDPCFPLPSWDGLNCSYNGYKPPEIISLNLSSKGLTGGIYAPLSYLKSLKQLDLSNNSLTGSLPDFLAQLPHLSLLNLEGNKLSGSVPPSLLAKSQNGSLFLSIGRNPGLCLSVSCEKKKKNIVIPLVGATVPLLVIIIAILIFWSYKRKRAAKVIVNKSNEIKKGSLQSDNRQFTHAEVVNITNNFQNILGKGGSGTVYRGHLANGTEVAVKMLSASSAQGSKQYQAEAQLLMRVHHRNLVSLVGYCDDGGNFGIIYEYMAFGNLHQYLFDSTRESLSWKQRLQIAVDASQGLEYLHHGCKPPIIHRDVKSANILLNAKLQAKIADFGFSRFFPTESESHISTSVVGTMGYLDPEYYASNWLTEKSDVYSFGVVLLELITGQPATTRGYNNTHIVQRVSSFLGKGDIESIIDPRLEGNFNINSVWKAVETAMECVPSISIQRPTMSHVVIQLKECLEMETAREQIRRTESQMLGLSSSIDMSPVDTETEMRPQAR